MKRILLPLAALVAIPATAQQEAALAPQPPPEITFRIIRQTRIDRGDHRLILNRVVPPVLSAVPVQIPQSGANAAGTATEENSQFEKKTESLFLSATVHERKFTEIRWAGGGQRCRAFSNIDFNLLIGVGSFETNDTVYSLMIAPSDETLAGGAVTGIGPSENVAPVLDRTGIPFPVRLSLSRAQYQSVDNETGSTPDPKDLAALDALHQFYDANRQRLAEEYLKRQALEAKRQRWAEEHHPVRKDTTVNFWPGKGTIFLDATSKGARP